MNILFIYLPLGDCDAEPEYYSIPKDHNLIPIIEKFDGRTGNEENDDADFLEQNSKEYAHLLDMFTSGEGEKHPESIVKFKIDIKQLNQPFSEVFQLKFLM